MALPLELSSCQARRAAEVSEELKCAFVERRVQCRLRSVSPKHVNLHGGQRSCGQSNCHDCCFIKSVAEALHRCVARDAIQVYASPASAALCSAASCQNLGHHGHARVRNSDARSDVSLMKHSPERGMRTAKVGVAFLALAQGLANFAAWFDESVTRY